MKLIVGLGNPGEKYRGTRHNLGYLVLDAFAKSKALSWRYSSEWLGFYTKTEEFVLLKPSTFMNRSGESVRPAVNFFKIENRNTLIVHDDLDLELGKIRISFDSSSAGHNGVESIIGAFGNAEFARLRVGIGKAPKGKGEEYVLKKFTSEEEKKLPDVIQKATEAINTYLDSGIEATMNSFN